MYISRKLENHVFEIKIKSWINQISAYFVTQFCASRDLPARFNSQFKITGVRLTNKNVIPIWMQLQFVFRSHKTPFYDVIFSSEHSQLFLFLFSIKLKTDNRIWLEIIKISNKLEGKNQMSATSPFRCGYRLPKASQPIDWPNTIFFVLCYLFGQRNNINSLAEPCPVRWIHTFANNA